MDVDNEARLDVLRRRAGSPSLHSSGTNVEQGTDQSAREEGQGEGEDRELKKDDDAENDADDNLPSTSSLPDASAKFALLDRQREKKLKAEKREKKVRERLDFDWPGESARREKKREEKRAEKGMKEGGAKGGEEGMRPTEGRGTEKASARREVDGYDLDDNGRSAAAGDVWESGGHVNLFADLEKNVSPVPVIQLVLLFSGLDPGRKLFPATVPLLL